MDVILYTDPKTTLATLGFQRKLGETEVVVAFAKHENGNKEVLSHLAVEGLTVKSGLVVKDGREAQRYEQKYDVIIAPATRDCLESKAVDIIYHAELLEKKDKTHRRGSGLNQVAAKLVKEKEKTYALDLSLVLDGKERAKMLGRMRQNKTILDKYGCKTRAYSHAQTWTGVRPPKEREFFRENL
ncbi:MAG: hypothetical protein ACLFO2_00430 [Candidatus Woesearchaeota archaeon]